MDNKDLLNDKRYCNISDLLPCPFCGENIVIDEVSTKKYWTGTRMKVLNWDLTHLCSFNIVLKFHSRNFQDIEKLWNKRQVKNHD